MQRCHTTVGSFNLSLVKMVRKEKLVIALAWLLLMASIIMSANAMAGACLNKVEHMVHPQGKVELLILLAQDFLSYLTTFTLTMTCACACDITHNHDIWRLSLLLVHLEACNSLWKSMLWRWMLHLNLTHKLQKRGGGGVWCGGGVVC